MPADLDLLDEVYAFARARAVERTQAKGLDEHRRRVLIGQLRNLQWAYAEAMRHGTNATIAAAIDVCRKAAMQDESHPDYDHIWDLPEELARRARLPQQPPERDVIGS